MNEGMPIGTKLHITKTRLKLNPLRSGRRRHSLKN